MAKTPKLERDLNNAIDKELKLAETVRNKPLKGMLTAQEIKQHCVTALPALIDPFVEKGVQNGKSFGLSHAGYDIRSKQKVTLYPVTLRNLLLKSVGFSRPSFALLSTIEYFNFPNWLTGQLVSKSSWARQGLNVSPILCEPGWHGFVTLGLMNNGPHIIKIREGDPIAQLIFVSLENNTQNPYRGKYQNQENMPVLAREEAVKGY